MATTKNTRTVTNETLADVLTRAQRLRLDNVGKRTGFTCKQMVRRGLGLWLECEAPVYLAQAKEGRRVRML